MTNSSPLRVLVVDEEEALTDLLRMTLEFEGWEARIAGTGTAAIAAMTEFRPDIVLLDVTLPDADGRDIARTLRDSGVRTPIVFLTGRTSLEDRMRGYAAGGDDWIDKPFSLEAVVDHLVPIARRLGRTPDSRRYGDLVLDQATGQVWRGDEQIPLNPLEVELLRELIARAEMAVPTGALVLGVTHRGIRLSRETAEAMLLSLASKLGGDGTIGVHRLTGDGWILSSTSTATAENVLEVDAREADLSTAGS